MQNFDKIKMFKVHESIINFYSPIFFCLHFVNFWLFRSKKKSQVATATKLFFLFVSSRNTSFEEISTKKNTQTPNKKHENLVLWVYVSKSLKPLSLCSQENKRRNLFVEVREHIFLQNFLNFHGKRFNCPKNSVFTIKLKLSRAFMIVVCWENF